MKAPLGSGRGGDVDAGAGGVMLSAETLPGEGVREEGCGLMGVNTPLGRLPDGSGDDGDDADLGVGGVRLPVEPPSAEPGDDVTRGGTGVKTPLGSD